MGKKALVLLLLICALLLTSCGGSLPKEAEEKIIENCSSYMNYEGFEVSNLKVDVASKGMVTPDKKAQGVQEIWCVKMVFQRTGQGRVETAYALYFARRTGNLWEVGPLRWPHAISFFPNLLGPDRQEECGSWKADIWDRLGCKDNPCR